MLHVFLLSALLLSAIADPIVIRSGLNKANKQHHDDNHFDSKAHKGIANFEGEEGFNRNAESKRVKAQNNEGFNQENGVKNEASDLNNYSDNKFHQQKGQNDEDFSKKESSKKGHHKTGFKKSYFKDEGGKEESYFDDEDNEGGQYVKNSKKQAYGDEGAQSGRGEKYNDQRYLQNGAKKGVYEDGGNYEKDLGSRQNYHGKKYRDDEVDQARRNGGRQFEEGRHYGEEKYYNKPYYNEYPNERKTITIYEDPRYDGGYDYNRYPRYDDYIQLDVKRPTRGYDYDRYYDNRPHSYDYYY